MKIGLVSDSHGNVDYLVLAAERLVGQHHVDRLFHLGGGSRDVEEVIAFKKKMLRGTEEYGDDAFLADVADFLSAGGSPSEGDEIGAFRKLWTVVPDEPAASTERKVMDMLGTHLTIAVHDALTLTAEDLANAAIILHGKVARYGAIEKKKRWFLCPGHLRDKEHEGRPATFAVLEIVPKNARMSVYGIGGEMLQDFPLTLEKRGKMTVK